MYSRLPLLRKKYILNVFTITLRAILLLTNNYIDLYIRTVTQTMQGEQSNGNREIYCIK